MLIPISITMLVKNASAYLAQSLGALQDFAEIIVLDNGSTDNTLLIAAQFPNVKLHEHPFIGFGPMKNLAASYTRYDWVINVDSDEVFTPELVEEIKSLNLNHHQNVYAMGRLNHYRGKPIKTCAWYPDIVKRMYHKKQLGFNNKQVHESLELSDQHQLITLNNTFLHYSYDSASALIHKMQHYTDLFVEQQRYRQHTSIWGAVGHGLSAFFKNYFLKKGLLSGADGFVISFSNAIGSYYKYVKLYEANQALSTSLIIVAQNKPKALEQVLASVAQQKVLPREIVVVGELPPESMACLQLYTTQLPIHYVAYKASHPDLLKRKAISVAKHDYIIMIDDTTLLHPYFMADHIAVAQKNRGVVGRCHPVDRSLNERSLQQGGNVAPIVSRRRIPFFKQKFAKRLVLTSSLSFSHHLAFFKEEAIVADNFDANDVGKEDGAGCFIAHCLPQLSHIIELRYCALADCVPDQGSEQEGQDLPTLHQGGQGVLPTVKEERASLSKAEKQAQCPKQASFDGYQVHASKCQQAPDTSIHPQQGGA